jgi:hypothetical protein
VAPMLRRRAHASALPAGVASESERTPTRLQRRDRKRPG